MTTPTALAHKAMESTCLVWVGATNNLGYGIVHIDGRRELAHRIAYEAAFGPIPDGLVIDHKCRVRCCIKPEHLEAVTQAENIRRGRSAAALAVGDECQNSHRITDESLLYRRTNGKTECMACRREGRRANRAGQPRETRQRRASAVASTVRRADAA